MFSVVMPVYNAAHTLKESVMSVLNQTFPDFELIIVDDCSTDESPEIIKELCAADARLVSLRLPENSGVAVARNEAIKAAAGRYICFLDADDIWLPDKLEQHRKAFSAGALVVCSSYLRFLPDGYESLITVPESFTYQDMLKRNIIGNLTGAYDSLVLGKFYQKSIGHEDYLMWLQIMAAAGTAVGLTDPLAKYRVGAGSLSGSKLKAAQWTWRIYRQELKLSFFTAVRCFATYAVNAFTVRIGSVKGHKA